MQTSYRSLAKAPERRGFRKEGKWGMGGDRGLLKSIYSVELSLKTAPAGASSQFLLGHSHSPHVMGSGLRVT